MNQKKILIVEDDKMLREVLVEIFNEAGWTSLESKNGIEAMEILETAKPDVILSDINMPRMDGLKLLSELSVKNYTYPVIFLSGYRDLDKMRAAWQYSVFDFVDKPFDTKSLLQLCENAAQFGQEYVVLARQRFTKISRKNSKISESA